jgi:multiple sugar transport system substrate-binding protein
MNTQRAQPHLTRRRMLRDAALGLSLASGGTAFLVGCGTTTTPPSAPLKIEGPLTYMSWTTQGPLFDWFTEFGVQLANKNEGLKPSFMPIPAGAGYYEKLTSMLAGGQAPDVWFTDTNFIPSYVERKAILGLDALIKRDRWDMADYLSSGISQYKYQNAWYGLPRGIGGRYLIHNLESFRADGVAVPPSDWADRGWTFDDVLSAATRLTKRDGTGQAGPASRWGFLVASELPAWAGYVFSNGGSILDKSNTSLALHEPAAVDALQFLQDLMFKHRVAPRPGELQAAGAASDPFISGHVAMTTKGGAAYQALRQRPELSWDASVPPRGKSSRTSLVFSSGWCAWKDSKQAEAAWTFMKHVTGKETQQIETDRGLAQPARYSVANSPAFSDPKQLPAHPKVAIIEAANGQAPPMIPNWTEVNDAIISGLAPLWTGAQPARTVVESLKPTVDALLKRNPGNK